MDRPLRFVRRLDAVFRVLIETPVGCWLIDCNGPSPPFFEARMEGYERVPAPDAWMTEQTITPAQAARLRETAVSITAMKAIRSIIEQADSRREPIRQVDGDKINEDKLIERGQPT